MFLHLGSHHPQTGKLTGLARKRWSGHFGTLNAVQFHTHKESTLKRNKPGNSPTTARIWSKDNRPLWVALDRLWPECRALVPVRPDTVVAGNRMGFRLCWRWNGK